MDNRNRRCKLILSLIVSLWFGAHLLYGQYEQRSKPTKASVAKKASFTQFIGFESASPGKFEALSLASGRWTAEKNHAAIHSMHQRTGKNSLRILGGNNHQVEWSLARELMPKKQIPFRLDLWFERWTRREPFEFKIEALVGKEWNTVHHDTSKAIVGSFKNHLSLSIPTDAADANATPAKIRFSATSPIDTGVMIDDIRIVPETPMKVVSVKCKRFEAPVLVRNQVNVLFDVQVETSGSLKPIHFTKLTWQDPSVFGVQNSAAKILAGIDVFGSGRNGSLPNRNSDALKKTATLLGSASANETSITGTQLLLPGTNHFFISARLTKSADIDGKLSFQPVSVTIAGKEYSLSTHEVHDPFRFGIALRKAGDDNSSAYRIPGLATTKKGTLIAVYDIRRRGGRDLPGDVDVGMSRSVDGGRTWTPMSVIMDMGDDPKWSYDGIGDPAILVDKQTGTIWCAATWSHGNRSWNGSGPGMKPVDTGQLMLVKSDDDGLTWSRPINITSQVKKPEWCFLLQGPGKGITMRDGTIVFAAQFQDTPENKRLPRSTILYSKDHGETWALGTGAFDDTTEAQVVEIEPGVLMLNCRYNRQSTRVVMVTRDMGKTWHKHPTSQRSLIEPRACMGSLINIDAELGKPLSGKLLFSNPDSLRARERIVIKASTDNGSSWPKRYRLLIDEGVGAGYSCMTMIDKDTVGILYEGNPANLIFQRIKLSEIFRETNNDTAPDSNQDGEQIALTLADVFQDHMVLQSGKPIVVFGAAKPFADVVITLDDETKRVRSNRNGQWRTGFAARNPSFQRLALKVESENELVAINDILIGDVWICAGQSNMEWTLEASVNGLAEMKNAKRSGIRLLNWVGAVRGSAGAYNVRELQKLHAGEFMDGQWSHANVNSTRPFSAVGWFFGRMLEKTLLSSEKSATPIGLINVSTGGTPTESWMDQEVLASNSELKNLVEGDWLDNPLLGVFCKSRGKQNLLPGIQAGENVPADACGPNHSFKPGFMWESAMKPLLPFSIRGVLWYQGESNAESLQRVRQHDQLFPLLVHDWRRQWNSDFPFLVVQLPAIEREFWPHFRESQRRLAGKIEGVELVTTIDTGHRSNVHPPHKKMIGERLASLALEKVYGLRPTGDSQTTIESIRRIGNSIELLFGSEGTELESKDGKPLRHFEVAGNDQKFFPAIATIEQNRVALSSSKVSRPEYVRYAFVPYPDPPVNFYNKNGWPVSPFVEQLVLVADE